MWKLLDSNDVTEMPYQFFSHRVYTGIDQFYHIPNICVTTVIQSVEYGLLWIKMNLEVKSKDINDKLIKILHALKFTLIGFEADQKGAFILYAVVQE